MEFPNVKVRKHQKMTQCTECAVFKEAFLKKLSQNEFKRLEVRRKAHLTLQRIAREKYYKHRTKSQENPQQYLSLIIDNMDQSKTNLPRFPFVSKADNSLTKLHHHVTGVLCHSLQKAYAFTWTDQFASNCNVTLNCLMTVLDDVAKNNGGSLPPTLYLQADNAAKDNKNNYVLMFLAMLVKAEIVKKIKLSFLMVGHTHEDVDQFFSRISVKCYQQAAVTLPDLHQLISTSVKPMPYIQHINSLWDFRKLATSDYSLCDFKDIHHFVFRKADDKVTLKFKNWPLHSEPYRELDVTNAIPDLDVPSIVEGIQSKFTSIVTNMSGDFQKWMSTGRFMQEHLDWWKDYLETFSRRKERPNVPLPTNFPKFKIPKKQTPTLESNVIDVIDKHFKKCQKKSVIRLVKKRR